MLKKHPLSDTECDTWIDIVKIDANIPGSFEFYHDLVGCGVIIYVQLVDRIVGIRLSVVAASSSTLALPLTRDLKKKNFTHFSRNIS